MAATYSWGQIKLCQKLLNQVLLVKRRSNLFLLIYSAPSPQLLDCCHGYLICNTFNIEAKTMNIKLAGLLYCSEAIPPPPDYLFWHIDLFHCWEAHFTGVLVQIKGKFIMVIRWHFKISNPCFGCYFFLCNIGMMTLTRNDKNFFFF